MRSCARRRRPATSTVATSGSNTTLPRAGTIGCRRWQRSWRAARSPCSSQCPPLRLSRPRPRPRPFPIVFSTTDDPIKLGLVASLARPGANATGAYFFLSDLAAKQLRLLRELVPAAVRIGLLVNPENANVENVTQEVTAAASAMGMQIDVARASTAARSRPLSCCSHGPRPMRSLSAPIRSSSEWPSQNGRLHKASAGRPPTPRRCAIRQNPSCLRMGVLINLATDDPEALRPHNRRRPRNSCVCLPAEPFKTRGVVSWGQARRMSMSLLLVRTVRGFTGGASKSSCGITARTRKAHASPLGRALRSVLLGVSAVGVTFVTAALWAVASVLLDIG